MAVSVSTDRPCGCSRWWSDPDAEQHRNPVWCDSVHQRWTYRCGQRGTETHTAMQQHYFPAWLILKRVFVLLFVFCQAIAALSKLSNTKAGLDSLFRSDLLNKLKDVMLTNDIIRYRVYEVRDNRRMKGVNFIRDLILIVCVCVCPVDSGGVLGVSSVSGLLRQQQFNLTAAGRTDRRWYFGQVMISHTHNTI